MVTLDEVDRKIISKLQLEGRATFKEIGRTIGYTSMGAKKRVKKLLEHEVIKTSTLLNLKNLNLTAAIIFLEMESAEAVQKLLKRFKECPRVVNIFTTLGGFNLIALVIAENQDTLESISIEKCSLRSSKGIRRSEFYPIGDIHYSPFLPMKEHLTHKKETIAPCNVDCRPCQRYQSKKCGGCPTTTQYQGIL